MRRAKAVERPRKLLRRDSLPRRCGLCPGLSSRCRQAIVENRDWTESGATRAAANRRMAAGEARAERKRQEDAGGEDGHDWTAGAGVEEFGEAELGRRVADQSIW